MKKEKNQINLSELDAEDPIFKAEYNKLNDAFLILGQILEARRKTKLTQRAVAQKMKTTQSSIARLENNLAAGKLPSFPMLYRYAAATGQKLAIKFVKD